MRKTFFSDNNKFNVDMVSVSHFLSYTRVCALAPPRDRIENSASALLLLSFSLSLGENVNSRLALRKCMGVGFMVFFSC